MRPIERHTNRALAWLSGGAFLTGWLAFASGTPAGRWIVVAHGVAGLGLVTLAPWKALIARRGLRRPRPGRGTSLVLTVLALVTLGSGVALTTGNLDRVGPLTTMQVHVGAGVGMLVLGLAHLRRRPVRSPDRDRRRFLRAGATAVAAGVLWAGWEAVLAATSLPGSRRRFTGSHQQGSHEPARMPVTQWLDDPVLRIDPGSWRLEVGGDQFTLDELQQAADEEVTATLDCTGGWYAEQRWRGVRLDRLVDASDARSVVVWSATGYARRFPADDLSRLWLCVGYEGERLREGHGFPARLVAPGRRGFWWVKWVVRVETSPLPWWVQSPFPVT